MRQLRPLWSDDGMNLQRTALHAIHASESWETASGLYRTPERICGGIVFVCALDHFHRSKLTAQSEERI